MDQSNSAKMATAKAPQLEETEPLTKTDSALSAVERHLGLIKLMAIIMAVLIVAALVVIGVTIYARLTGAETTKNAPAHDLVIPFDSRVTDVSLSKKGQVLLLIEDTTGQQLWQVDPDGKVRRKTRFVQSP
jgi:multidrug resistance efflux pump